MSLTESGNIYLDDKSDIVVCVRHYAYLVNGEWYKSFNVHPPAPGENRDIFFHSRNNVPLHEEYNGICNGNVLESEENILSCYS